MIESDLQSLKRQYIRASKAYYNKDKPIMSDASFNDLEKMIRKLEPTWDQLKKTGVKVADKKTEVDLLEFMPSLNKMYPEAVDKFYARPSSKKVEAWIWMDKLDGTSLQLAYEKGVPTRLITRGDGTRGGDISFFIPHLLKLGRIPARIPVKTRVVFRIEGLMQKKIFAKYWADKFDNIRNMVNGLFNRKDMHPALKHVDLVVLGVYGMSLPTGLKLAAAQGFNPVRLSIMRLVPSVEEHGEFLEKWRDESLYEMDGLVIAPTDWVMEYTNAERPKALIAFKFNDEEGAAEVPVLRNVWQKTRLKRWQPKVEIPPTEIDGVVVRFATCHNPAWMMEKGIGPGAIIKVLRSGGVIPKIVGVVKKAKFQGPPGPYLVDGRLFRMVDHDETTDARGILHFMRSLGVELLALKTIAKLYDIGFTTPESYIKLAHASDKVIKHQLANAELGPTQSAKIVAELKRVLCGTISLKKLMVASGCFAGGIGERRLSMLEKAGISMRVLGLADKDWIWNEVGKVKGFKGATIQALVDGVLAFRKWYKPIKGILEIEGELPAVKKVNAKGKLAGLKIAFTGYRDKYHEVTIETLGGEVTSFSTKTDILLYTPEGKASTKVAKAGTKAMTWEAFTKKYGV